MNLFERVRALLDGPRSRAEVRATAHQAGLWLEDETLNRALASLRRRAENTWLTSWDTAVREECWRELHRIDLFVRDLQRLLADEQVAATAEAKRTRRREAAGTGT